MSDATSQVVADTHVIVWYLTDSDRLSPPARQALERCVADGYHIVANSICLAELVYAAEKTKNPLTDEQRDHIFGVLDEEDSPFVIVATTPATARAMVTIPRETLPDPADRAIAATAIAMDLPVVTADERLRQAAGRGVLRVIW